MITNGNGIENTEEVQKIKEPVHTNPQLVQILGRAGFIVTNNDVIVRKKGNLILRKRINGENPDGSPKYFDVPMQLSVQDQQDAEKVFTVTKTETTDTKEPVIELLEQTPKPVVTEPTTPTNQESTPITLESTVEETPSIIPEITEEPTSIESAIINGTTVTVGQVLATAPHIAIVDFQEKTDGVHAILVHMKTGETADVAIPQLESVTSLSDIESLFL